jgi:signal transduction histidine kinase
MPVAGAWVGAGPGGCALLVGEILDRTGYQIHEVGPDWPVRRAAAMLAAWNVGTVLVTDFEGSLIGIISERDIIRSLNEFGGSVLRLKVRDLMTRSVVTCTLETEIGAALTLMAFHRIRHLPVVQDGKIRGIISIRDVLKFRVESLEESFTALVRSEQESAQARAEAELANRAKTDFLAHMSHELRTPLNAMIGFSDVIAGGLLGPDSTALNREYAAHINTAGRHLLKLVDEVLDLSKAVSGQLDLD